VRATPPLVERALALAERLRFDRSSIPEVGRLLHVLAAERGRGRVAEIGSGCGVGAAWIVSGLDPSVPFFTVETDDDRAAAVRELFREDPNVTVLHGDWKEMLAAEAPFDLLFLDGGGQAAKSDEAVLGLLAPRGTVVIDDLTPGRPGPDSVRELWLGHPRLASTELLTTPTTAAIVAVRVR
jgi:predicted O-methyltransferase YrrM